MIHTTYMLCAEIIEKQSNSDRYIKKHFICEQIVSQGFYFDDVTAQRHSRFEAWKEIEIPFIFTLISLSTPTKSNQ